MPQHIGLEHLIDDLLEATDSEDVTLGQVVDALATRGFGPMLMLPALLIVSPLGMIPGAPDLLAIFLILIASQMVLGMDCPWMPARLRKISIGHDRFVGALERIRPWLNKARKLVHPRLHFMNSNVILLRVIAFSVIIPCMSILSPLGFIPGVPFVFALPALVFGLGLTTRDGLITLFGYLFMIPGLYLIIGRLL